MEETISALAQGVKLIGIGKHGSKKMPEELIIAITDELKQGNSPAILVGAFFGALLMKEIEPAQYVLEEFSGKGSLSNTEILWNNLLADAPTEMKPLGIKLLNKEELTESEAYELGLVLLSDKPGEAFKGLAMSILRIRYETMDEYKGLYDAIVNTAPSTQITFDNKPRIQLAEPFDGVNRSYIITPIIAKNLQNLGYNVLVSCGESAGPKNVLNTWNVYQELNAEYLIRNAGIINTKPKLGWTIDQKEFYPQLHPWVEKRRKLMKRPYLATLEKVLNPCKSGTLITSVFHIPYLEKMVELGFMAGFTSVMVLKRGQEGSLAPSLSKATGLLCAVKRKDGSILTTEIDTKSAVYEELKIETDDFIEDFNPKDNIRLIKQYLDNGISENDTFNKRVNFATLLYKEGLDWIKENE
jgi:anthranilate phosphoribosyltransferase